MIPLNDNPHKDLRDLTDSEIREGITNKAKSDARASIERRKRYKNRLNDVKIAQKPPKTRKISEKVWILAPVLLFCLGLAVLCLGWV